MKKNERVIRVKTHLTGIQYMTKKEYEEYKKKRNEWLKVDKEGRIIKG